ncbi:MAG: type II secretion system protein N [Pseudomonadota bacterium]
MKAFLTLVNLILIFLITDLTISAMVGSFITKMDTSDAVTVSDIKQQTLEPKSFQNQSHYSNIAKRDLFKTIVISTTPATPVQQPVKEPEAQLTKLKLELKGTITGTGSNPLAVIKKNGETKQMLYAVGDSIDRAVIRAVMKGKVILLVDGKEEVLLMETRKSSDSSVKEAPPIVSSPMQADTTDGFVEKVQLGWDDIAQLKGNMGDLRKQVRVRPHFDKGKMDGFRITNIKQESVFYERLGLRNGDIISGVNEKDLTSVQDVSTIYEGFNLSEGNVNTDIRIKRNGKSGKILYSIK